MTIKNLIATLALVTITPLPLAARTFVLAAGVSNYGNEAMNLNQSTKDVKAFKNLMSSQTNDITVLTSRYATPANILNVLEKFCEVATADDNIIFYFSGHGMNGGIVTHSALLDYTTILNTLRKSKASLNLCLIDACHSGSALQGDASVANYGDLSTNKKNTIFMVGCKAEEYSYENPTIGAGYFTQGLIKGIRGMADKNGDKRITIHELFRYVWIDVVKRSKSRQHPQLIGPKEYHEKIVAEWKD